MCRQTDAKAIASFLQLLIVYIGYDVQAICYCVLYCVSASK